MNADQTGVSISTKLNIRLFIRGIIEEMKIIIFFLMCYISFHRHNQICCTNEATVYRLRRYYLQLQSTTQYTTKYQTQSH